MTHPFSYQATAIKKRFAQYWRPIFGAKIKSLKTPNHQIFVFVNLILLCNFQSLFSIVNAFSGEKRCANSMVFLCQARDWHTNLPPFHDARPDHVPVENSSCFFPRELLSFVCPRRIWRVEFWNMTRDKFSSNRKTYLIWEVWRYMWGSRADFCALTLGPCPSSWIKGHLTRKLAQTGTAISLCILISQLPKILFSKRVSVTSFDNTKKKSTFIAWVLYKEIGILLLLPTKRARNWQRVSLFIIKLEFVSYRTKSCKKLPNPAKA